MTAGGGAGFLMCDGEDEAAIYAPIIEQDGTGTALPVVAALFGASESEMFAQRVQEGCPSIDEKPTRCPVHLKGNLNIHSLCFPYYWLQRFTVYTFVSATLALARWY
jgi:hypothetical protein